MSHYFTDGHAYAGLHVTIVGGANSAVIAALECWRHGAEVTMVHRGSEFRSGVKYWLRPDIENRIKDGDIRVLWESGVRSISERAVTLEHADGSVGNLRSDAVLLLTGYRADYAWLMDLGLALDVQCRPLISDTLESKSRAGIYCAGCVLCGDNTSRLFIENGREHAVIVAEALATSLRPRKGTGRFHRRSSQNFG